MNREDIIRMAREVGIDPESDTLCNYDGWVDTLVDFAVLVAAAEREKVAAWMLQFGFATGHGDTTEDLLKELDWQIDERIAAEREACAVEAERFLTQGRSPHGRSVAAAIRARGQA